MYITLPEALMDWAELQVSNGTFLSVDDYIVALVRRDMALSYRVTVSGNPGMDAYRYQLMEVRQAIEDSKK